jgi:hypothetical protein
MPYQCTMFTSQVMFYYLVIEAKFLLGLSCGFVVSKKKFEEFSKILRDTKLYYSISVAFNLTLSMINKLL